MAYTPHTQYTEGDTDSTITGTAAMWEDTSDTLRTASAAKPFPVNIITGGGGGTQYTEGDTDASITGTAFLWEDAADTLRAVSAAKPLPIGDAGGSLTVDDGGGSLTVDGTVTVQDGGGAISVDDNGGSLTVDGTVTANAGSGTFTVDQADTATADYDSGAGTVNQTMMGLALPASGGPVAGGTSTNPVRTDPTGTTAQPVTDNGGSITVDGTVALGAGTADVGSFHPFAQPSASVNGKTSDITNTTDTSVIAAQGGSTRTYLTHILVQNSHATVSTWVNIKDDTTTVYTIYAPAAGGGASLTLPKPLRGTANKAWQAACETTGANVRVSASGYTSTT